MRVSSSIPAPSRGWAGVTASSVGTVVAVGGDLDGEVEITVSFPECEEWIGFAKDLEIGQSPAVGEQVQVSLYRRFRFLKLS